MFGGDNEFMKNQTAKKFNFLARQVFATFLVAMILANSLLPSYAFASNDSGDNTEVEITETDSVEDVESEAQGEMETEEIESFETVDSEDLPPEEDQNEDTNANEDNEAEADSTENPPDEDAEDLNGEEEGSDITEPENSEPEETGPEETESEETEDSSEEETEEETVPEETEPEEDTIEDDVDAEIEEEQMEEEQEEEDFVLPTDFLNVAKLPEIAIMQPAPMLMSAAFFSSAPSLIENEFLETKKTVHFDETTGEYFIRLESYLIGEDKVERLVPCDIVLVLDQSGSMDYCFECSDDNADSVKYTAYYNGVIAGTMSEDYEYWCWNKDNTEIIQVYYCDNGDNCKYVDADGNKVKHTPRWATSDHRVETTVSGTYYMPGPTNSPNLTSKIFYRTSECKPEDAYYDVVNEKGETCFGKFSTKGIYYYNTSGKRLYYCEEHGAWFTREKCTSSNHTTTYLRYPRVNSSDKNYRSVTFYDQLPNHPVYGTAIDKTKTYKVKQSGRALGEPYDEIAYCLDCEAWHIPDNHDSVHYTPKSKKGASAGTTFYGLCTISRGDALQSSLRTFLDSIYDTSLGRDGIAGTDDDVHNRIAVVGFASGDTTSNAVLSYAEEGATEASQLNYSTIYGADSIAADPNGGTPDLSSLGHTLHYVSTETGQNIINTAVDNLVESGSTEIFKGFRMAKDVLEANPVDTSEERNRIIILFTDGEPVSSLDPGTDKYNTSTSYRFCDAALGYAKDAKDSGVGIYTIGIFSGANASNMLTTVGKAARNNANKFMHLLSSNFPSAEDSDIAYTAEDVNPDLKQGESYYLSTSTMEGLDQIFAAIATNIVGNAAYIQNLGSPSLIRDVISPSFNLQYGGDTSKIRLHTEAYRGMVDGIRTWENDNNTDVDSKVVVDIDTEVQSIEITGFSFTELYVATDTMLDGTITHRGRKIIVEIPIVPAANNYGGLKQTTNDQAVSAIYDEDSLCVENFDAPYMDTSANITIKEVVQGTTQDQANPFDFKVEYIKSGDYVSVEPTDKFDGNYLKIDSSTNEIVEFQLKHNEENNIDSIYSDSKIKISKLNAPKDYELYYSIEYPDGTSSGEIKFESGEVELDVVGGMVVTFTSKKITTVTIHKVTTGGTFIKDAGLQVIDKNGNVVESFTTIGEETVMVLEYGETYTLRETFIPTQYFAAADLHFTVGENEDNIVIMVNEPKVYMVSTGGSGLNELAKISCALSILAGIFVCAGKRKEESSVSEQREIIWLAFGYGVHNAKHIFGYFAQ